MGKGFIVDYMNDGIHTLAAQCDHTTLTIWALDCAGRVLPYFEAKYPEDHRPRSAIEAGHAWVRGELSMWQARKSAFPAHDAAREAENDLCGKSRRLRRKRYEQRA